MTSSSTSCATVAVAPIACQRSDTQRRAIVDHAITLQAHSNTVSAIEYLKAKGIAPPLIERVLLDPQRRRSVSL